MVVVITGASAGVGRATAREFARQGHSLALLARGRPGLEAAAREVHELGGRALVLPADVSRPDEVEAAATNVESTLGPIDIWINNAMVSVFSPVIEMTAEEFEHVTEVTYLGAVYGTLAALRRMKTRDKGMIVQVGSALAYRAIPLQSAYCGAKHGLRGFTDSLRSELLHDKINVHLTMVQLPALNTPQFNWVKSRLPREPQPVPPIFQPEVAARAIYWAAYHRRREVYVGFPVWKAIVGNKLIAGWLDRYLARYGYDAQQTHVTAAKRPANLWDTAETPYDAHGRFDEQAKSRSLYSWLTMHRSRLLVTSLAGVAVTIWRWSMTRSSSVPAQMASQRRSS